MVLGLMARLTRLMSTWRVSGSTGIVCTLMPMYAAPLSKAACAEMGMILMRSNSVAVRCGQERNQTFPVP